MRKSLHYLRGSYSFNTITAFRRYTGPLSPDISLLIPGIGMSIGEMCIYGACGNCGRNETVQIVEAPLNREGEFK